MKLRRSLTAITLTLALGSLAACGGGPKATPDQSGGAADVGASATSDEKLVIGSTTDPSSMNPADAQEGNDMPFYQAVYDTLLLREPNGDLSPMLATEWEYNDDLTELTLKLRDDVDFIDGEHFNAEVAKANMEHFQTAGGPQAPTMGGVTDIATPDEYTLVLTLDAPDPAFLIYLSNAAGMMASPAAIGTDGINTVPVGSGPYVLDRDKTQAGTLWTYTKNDDYWNPDLQHYGAIDILIFSDAVARSNALLSGQVDWAQVEVKQAQAAEDAGLVAHHQAVDWFGIFIADRSGEKIPALGDVNVRQAINYAIDADAILNEINLGYGDRTTQIFAPSTTAYVESLNAAYPYDPEKAKELMAEAGYADGFDINMPTAVGFFDPAMISVVQDQLAAIGIRSSIEEMPVSDYVSAVLTGDYPIFIMQLFRPSTWATIQQAVAPNAVWNPSHYEDPQVSELITKIQFAESEEAEREFAQELNTILVEDAWFNPWFGKDQLSFAWGDRVDVEVQAEQVIPSIYNFKPAN